MNFVTYNFEYLLNRLIFVFWANWQLTDKFSVGQISLFCITFNYIVLCIIHHTIINQQIYLWQIYRNEKEDLNFHLISDTRNKFFQTIKGSVLVLGYFATKFGTVCGKRKHVCSVENDVLDNRDTQLYCEIWGRSLKVRVEIYRRCKLHLHVFRLNSLNVESRWIFFVLFSKHFKTMKCN